MTTMTMRPSHPEFRNGVYAQIYDAALAVARNQQPDVAAHAEDIAMSVVERFANRHMTAQVENPAAWGATAARYACVNYATRQLARDRSNRVDEEFWDQQVDPNPAIYPYKAVAGADAIAYALSCLSDRERELVHLAEAGYSHAEIAEMMGYASARSVTTTLSRIRTKIIDHVGGREELDELMCADVRAMTMQAHVRPVDRGAESDGVVGSSAPLGSGNSTGIVFTP
jgi:RNA polymerase sigma factor (sigma-70 family)